MVIGKEPAQFDCVEWIYQEVKTTQSRNFMNRANKLTKRLTQVVLLVMFSNVAYAVSWSLMGALLLSLSLIGAVMAVFVSHIAINEAEQQIVDDLYGHKKEIFIVWCGASYGWAIIVFITAAYKLGGYLGYW